MSDQDDNAAGIASYDDVMRSVQAALTAVGSLERTIGDLGSDRVLGATRTHLESAVRELQEVRQRVAESIGR